MRTVQECFSIGNGLITLKIRMQKPLTKNSSGFESQESVFYIYF